MTGEIGQPASFRPSPRETAAELIASSCVALTVFGKMRCIPKADFDFAGNKQIGLWVQSARGRCSAQFLGNCFDEEGSEMKKFACLALCLAAIGCGGAPAPAPKPAVAPPGAHIAPPATPAATTPAATEEKKEPAATEDKPAATEDKPAATEEKKDAAATEEKKPTEDKPEEKKE